MTDNTTQVSAAARLDAFLEQFDIDEQERILRYALDHVLPRLKGAQATPHPEPSPTTVQEPMHYDQLVKLWKQAISAHNSWYSIDWYRAGVRDAEAHHGIAARAALNGGAK